MPESENRYIIVCITTAEAQRPMPGAVIRQCEKCGAKLWYAPKADERLGKGTPSFFCMPCMAEEYNEEEHEPPEVSEATRRVLRGMGFNDQEMAEAELTMTADLIGRRKRQ